MGSYDSPKFAVRKIFGPIFGTFPATAATTAEDTKVCTCLIKSDRFEFFRNIRLTGMKVTTVSGTHRTSNVTSHLVPKLFLTNDGLGTDIGSCTVGTALLSTDGVIHPDYVEVNKDTKLRMSFKIVGDGTATTIAACSVKMYLEYKDMGN